MKKVLVVVLMFVTLFGLSGCDKEENNKEIKQEVLIVEYRNDYYDFDCGDYYYYRFEVGQNGNTFKDGNRRWFKTNEKWEIDDVVIVSKIDGELYFLKIGNLNFEEK